MNEGTFGENGLECFEFQDSYADSSQVCEVEQVHIDNGVAEMSKL